MSRSIKEMICGDIKKAYADLDSAMVVNVHKLSGTDVNTLRGLLKKQKVSMHVVKNRFAKRVLAGTALEPIGAVLTGPYGAGGMAGWMVGGPVGAVVGATVEEILRKAVTSEPGRKAVKHLAKEGRGHIDALELHRMLGQITAGASAGAVAGVSGMGESQQTNMPLEQ